MRFVMAWKIRKLFLDSWSRLRRTNRNFIRWNLNFMKTRTFWSLDLKNKKVRRKGKMDIDFWNFYEAVYSERVLQSTTRNGLILRFFLWENAFDWEGWFTEILIIIFSSFLFPRKKYSNFNYWLVDIDIYHLIRSQYIKK